MATESNERLQIMRHRLTLAMREAERASRDIPSIAAALDEVCLELARRKVFA